MKRLFIKKKKKEGKKQNELGQLRSLCSIFCWEDLSPPCYLIAYYTISDKMRRESILIVPRPPIERTYIEFISDLNTILIINGIKWTTYQDL